VNLNWKKIADTMVENLFFRFNWLQLPEFQKPTEKSFLVAEGIMVSTFHDKATAQ